MTKNIKDIFANPRKENEKHEDLYRVKKVSYSKDDIRTLNTFLKKIMRKQYSASSQGGHASFSFNAKNQRAVFFLTHSSSMKTHNAYLHTYMSQENKKEVLEKPVLFGDDTAEYENAKVKKHFKCVISPENENIDLCLLSRQFIKRLEEVTGYHFYWKGAVHTNTQHKHVHILINGKDKNGNDVYFKKNLIRHSMRDIVCWTATQIQGERTEKEIALAKAHTITAKRWTKIDDELEQYFEGKSLLLTPPQENRLQFLASCNLCEKKNNRYVPSKNWKEILVATGRYNSFFEQWQKRNGELSLYHGGAVTGKVMDEITFGKDESWNDALIVKTEKDVVYVPVWNLENKKLTGKTIQINADEKTLSKISLKNISVIDDIKNNIIIK